MPTFTGTTGNDLIEGSSGDDVIFGLDGNDTIRAGDGNDLIDGGAGIDTVSGGDGNDTLTISSVVTGFPQPTQSTFDGGPGVDTVDFSRFTLAPSLNWSSSGSEISVANYRLINVDRLIGTNGRDSFGLSSITTYLEINAGSGDDTVNGGSGGNLIFGGDGNDSIYGGDGDDLLYGGAGNDVLVLIKGADQAFGGDGDDTFRFDFNGGGINGAQVADGGAGSDTASFYTTKVSIDLSTGLALEGFSNNRIALTSIENITVSYTNSGASVIGNDGANTITLMDVTGGSTVDGRGGSDTIIGSASHDNLRGGDGDDQIDGGSGNDILNGDAGDDMISGGRGNDTIDGGLGSDTLSFEGVGDGGTTASLLSGTAAGTSNGSGSDVFTGIENLRGSDFADTLIGDGAANRLEGRAGSDVLRGGGGSDYIDGGTSADSLYGEEGDDILVGGSSSDTIDGGAGFDIAIFGGLRSASTITNLDGQIVVDGPDGRDVLSGVEQLQFADGIVDVDASGRAASEVRLTLTGTGASDTLTGGGSRDTLSGGAGNDLLRGGGNSDVLNGGSGVDAALYSGLRLQYSASSTAVSGGPEGGTDTLVSIEEARFVDGVLSFDVDSVVAQVMRLYDTALDRAPDQGGLESLTQAVQSGSVTLQQLASAFLSSPEFQARYGALSNQAFVEQLYRFSLDREGDAGGIASWTNTLNTGTSRDSLLLLFSESAEHRTLTAGAVAAGLWLPDAEALAIARLYDTTFERLPDAAGLASWTGVLESGRPLLEIAAAFAGSAEFQTRYGALSNQAFVEQIYRASLDREGDVPGIAAWVNQLDQGASRASVLLAFSESAEHVALTAPLWSGGIQYAGYVAPASVEAYNESMISTSPALHPSDFDAFTAVDALDTAGPAMTSTETIVRVGSDFATDGSHHALFLPMADEFVVSALNLSEYPGQLFAQPQHDIEQVPTAQAEPVLNILDMPELFAVDGFDLHPQQPVGDYWLH